MTEFKKSIAAKPEYEPTAAELSAVKNFAGRQTDSPRFRVTKGTNGPRVAPDHTDLAVGNALLGEAVGTSDLDFLSGLLSQLNYSSARGGSLARGSTNFMLSLVKGIKPRDEVEAMLAAQMAAVHTAMMTFARRLGHAENIPQQDSAEARLQQAGPHVRDSIGGAETLSHRR